MQPESDNTDSAIDPVFLRVTNSQGNTSTIVLEPNTSLFAGAGCNCRIVLEDDDVFPIHCMFWLDEDNVLKVQDWNTGGRTLLNGNEIDEETVLEPGCKIQIGSNLIEPDYSPTQSTKSSAQSASGDVVANTNANVNENANVNANRNGESKVEESSESEEPEVIHSEPACSTEVVDTPPPAGPSESTRLESTCLEDGTPDSTPGEYEFEYEHDSELVDESSDNYDFSSQEIDESDSTREEEVEFLKLEIEQLRCDVADRDAELQMLGESDDCVSDLKDDDQTMQLVNRLEELLCELQNSDDRVSELEELLRVSDQAIQAEQEERQQLESWVTEIETRIGQREEESEAEKNRVQSRLNEVIAKHKHAESQLHEALASNAKGDSGVSKDALDGLSQQVNELQKRLDSTETENEELKKQSRDQGKDFNAQKQLQQLEQKMMEQEVETSRERADLARERVQLERLKNEFEQKLNSPRDQGDADTRIQAMRQHLQEIHEQEKLEQQQKKQFGLSGRISRLLGRVGN